MTETHDTSGSLSPVDERNLRAAMDAARSSVRSGEGPFGADVAGPDGLPILRTAPHLWGHPRRFHFYLDLMHFSAEGHEALAQALFDELRKTDLLEGGVA